MDRLKTIETFVQIVKSGSLSAAAGELGMSRALVSRHLQLLEQHLGAKLFNRTTRKLSLTEVGAEYFGFCTKMLAEFEEEESAIARLQKEPRGMLKVGASMAFGNLYLGPLVAEFIKLYPEIQMSFVLSDRPITPFDVIEKGYDLAICLHRIEDTTIVARKIGEVVWVACAAPSYLREHGTPQTPAQLRTHARLVHRSIAPNGIWHFDGPGGPCQIRTEASLTTNSVIALRSAVLANAGIALLPTYCIGEDLRTGRMKRVLPDYTVESRPIYVLYGQSTYVQRKARLFVDFLEERVQDMLPAAPDAVWFAAKPARPARIVKKS
jgi:DNA-binding transcriptional LysR family regulator